MQVGARALWLALAAIVGREITRFAHQPGRMLSALVRPLLWLLVFASGLHDLLGVSIVPPYATYTTYQEYITPGLIGIIVLFQCMQSALSMSHDREAGMMRVMLVTPLPRGFLVFARIVAASVLALLQVYAFLVVARLSGIELPALSWFTLVPATLLAGLMLGAIAVMISVHTPRLENFAGMMNFVVFPMFFLSSALYPLWKLREAGAWPVFYLASVNPFTHAVELIRFAAYGQLNWLSLAVVCGSAAVAFLLAAWGYRRGGKTSA